MVSPILPGYAEAFNVSYALVGLIISAFGIARILMDLPVGKATQKFDKKLILIVGLILVSTSSILAGIAPNYAILLVARFIEGAGSAIFITTASIILGQVVSGSRRGTLMSVYSGMLLLGAIFGPTFGGALATIFDIHAPFFAYALVSALGILPTLFLPKISHATSPNHIPDSFSLHDIKKALSNMGFVLILPAIFSLFFIRTGVRSTLVPLFAANNLNFSPDTIGILLTIGGITTAISMVPVGIISDRIGRRNPQILCLMLSALFSVGFIFANNFLMFSVMIGGYGLAVGLSGPIAAYVTDIAPPEKLSVYMGLYRMIGDIGFVVGPLLLGFVADITSVSSSGVELIGWIPFATAAVIMITASLFLFKAPDPIRKTLNMNKKASGLEI